MVYITEVGSGEKIPVPVDKDNLLSRQVLELYFPGAVGLMYFEEDVTKSLPVAFDESFTKFVPPADGWKDRIFYIVRPLHRTSSPMIVDSPIPKKEGHEIELMKNYVYTVDGVVACATAISVNILASCYHCIKHFVATGPNVDEISSHRNALIDLTHAVTNRKIKAKIRVYSIEKDVVLLQTDENLMVGDEIACRGAYLGQPYYVIETPISDDGSPLQVISGRISAMLGNRFSKSSCHSLHGHGSARPGASGGPVFDRHLFDAKPALLGIVVAGQNISHETTLLTFVSSNYVKVISIETLYAMYVHGEDWCVAVNNFSNNI